MDAVVIVDPVQYQRRRDERDDVSMPLRSLHFGPDGGGLVTFLATAERVIPCLHVRRDRSVHQVRDPSSPRSRPSSRHASSSAGSSRKHPAGITPPASSSQAASTCATSPRHQNSVVIISTGQQLFRLA